MKKKLLFIGSVYSENFIKFLRKHSLPDSSAGQTFEKGILEGLSKYCDVKCVNEFFVPTFPKCKKILIRREDFHLERVNCESIFCINLPVLKKITQFFSYLLRICRLARTHDLIVIYELTSRQLLPAVIAGGHIRKIAIVPDLPEFMSENTNFFYRLAKKIDHFLIDWALKHIDGYVLLSPYMKNRLPIGDRPWVVVEGLFSPSDSVPDQKKSEKKVLLYTGKIEKWFGLEDLLKAFTIIKGIDYQLWLCGPGDIEMIHRYSDNDSRIIYKGCLSHKEVLFLQKQATILINPRHSADEFTLYSFPSKTMEYMASGTPTLMSRLKSLPEDYYPYLFFFENETIEGMSSMIQKCLDLEPSFLKNFGREAASFILTNKTSTKQAKRIVDSLIELY